MVQLLRDPLRFEPPPRLRGLLLGVIFAIFVSVPLYQATRQPRIGDIDIARIGLVILNRYDQAEFVGDIAMQADVWWRYYTPAYLGLVGTLYSITRDFEIALFILLVAVYMLLLSGFYLLGRKLAFPYMLAVALALLSGLFYSVALGLPWGGLKLDMAAARNVYLAAVPWLLLLALTLYQRRDGTLSWTLFGVIVGIAANMHSMSGVVFAGVIGILLLAARFTVTVSWRSIAGYTLGTFPGLLVIYFTTYTDVAGIAYTAAQQNEILIRESIFIDLTRFNLIFYRPPNWGYPILIYSAASFLALAWLWFARHRATPAQTTNAWRLFGLVQFGAALMVLTQDWLVCFAALMWLQRSTPRREQLTALDFMDRVSLLALLALGMLIFCGGGLLTVISETGIFPPSSVLARALIRGIHLTVIPVLVLSIAAIHDTLSSVQATQKALYVLTALAVFALGFHQTAVVPPLEGIPFSDSLTSVGQLLPIDLAVYLGVLLLSFWRRFEGQWQTLRTGFALVLLIEAGARVLALTDMTLIALLFGGLVIVVQLGLRRTSALQVRGGLIAVMLVGTFALVLLPITGNTVFSRIEAATFPALTRNWSREDTYSVFYNLYRVGQWLAENTPPGTVILSNDSLVRYWAHRPLIGGIMDLQFLQPGTEPYAQVAAIYGDLMVLYHDHDQIIAFAERYGASYLMLTYPIDLRGHPAVQLEYENPYYRIYLLSAEG